MQNKVLSVDTCVDERDVFATSSPRVRAAVLVTGVVALAVLAPVIGEVYSSFGTASRANVIWVIVAVTCVFSGFASSWMLQRIALRVERWSDVAGPQLAGNAASNLLPLGDAFGSVIQLRMLRRNRVDLTRAVTSLTITGMLGTLAGLFLLPLLLLLPLGDSPDPSVETAARFGVVALLFCIPLVVMVLRSERPVAWVSRTVQRTLERIPRCRPPHDLAARIVAERDGVRRALQQHKFAVVASTLGRAFGDYLALYASLLAVGLRPSPVTVLVAFIAANAAGAIPLTPGGLGFVEAGLSGALVLAGVAEEQRWPRLRSTDSCRAGCRCWWA